MAKDNSQFRTHHSQLIRNSTSEFLIFTSQDNKNSIEARYKDETIWLTQKLIAELFEVDISTINEHLKNIYKNNELNEIATIGNFPIVQIEGKRNVKRIIAFYNLDAIISVGYRVTSVRATQSRQWATKILREFAIKGFVLDKKRLENGFLGNEWFFFNEQKNTEIKKTGFITSIRTGRGITRTTLQRYNYYVSR